MAKLKRMDQVKSILSNYQVTRSIKATARQLGISKNTVRNYVRRALAYDKDLNEVVGLPDERLIEVLYHSDSVIDKAREQVFSQQVKYWIKELRRVGVTRHLLWEEYRKEHAEGYGYSQFCERLKYQIARRDLTIAIEHVPGQVMQVDFAGKKMKWVDVSTGELHYCEMLVAVLPYSQQTFVIALPSQRILDFVEGLNQALLFFGKLPRIILSDNLKSYVVKSDKYEPEFTELCQQLSAHYQIELKATRVRKPKDKASVENMVSTVYGRIYAPLRNKIYHSIEELNEGVLTQLEMHNNKPYQKKQGSRFDNFTANEVPEMRALPSDLFEVKKVITAVVQRNYHVMLGEDKNYYSVHYKHVKKKATVIYTAKLVEIYIDNQRVATHKRLTDPNGYKLTTIISHMPRNHQEWKQARGYTPAYFSDLGQKIGPSTYWVIQRILLSRIHESQSFNSCKGIIALGKKYTPQRLEKACQRCQAVEKASYHMIKNILSKNLDRQLDEPDLFSIPDHTNVRGPQAYT